MTKISWAVVCLTLCAALRLHGQCSVDTTFSDVIFLIDNSGSIDSAEYAQFEQTILASVNKVKAKCPSANIGVMHYGGQFGRETVIEYPLASTNTFTQIERKFCTTRNGFGNCTDGGGDDLNAAIGHMIDSIATGRFMRNSSNLLSVVIFTDAFVGTDCNVFPACSQVEPYTNIDILKSAPYNASVAVIGVTQQAAANLLAVYASPGGTYNSPLDPACSTSADGCTLPRKYIATDFNSPIPATSDEIAGCVDCSIVLTSSLSVDAGADRTICGNLNESTTLSASISGSAPPYTYSWDNGLGAGAIHTVSPAATTTYRVTVTDSTGCANMDSVTVNVISCTSCDAYAGRPLDHLEHCLIDGKATLSTEQNLNVLVPPQFSITYVLTDQDLTVIDYRTGAGSFEVRSAGIYRIHTLVAQTTNRNYPDYMDLSIIEKGQSKLFIIANCLKDHNICADFDFAGRVHDVRGLQDMMCMPVENSINLCSDGLDNDNDGLTDCADADCQGLTVCLESTLVACNDLYDNDNDGLTDCYDPDCWRFKRCFEKEEKCSDGIDNDGDGLVDCADASCVGASSCMENNPISCVDGIDNDGDGLVDCADSGCQRFIVCAEYDATKCADGLDNDYDGLVDCADPDCQDLMAATCAPSEGTMALCSDGIDNDGDGLVDCDDPDCGYTRLSSLSPISDYIRTLDPTCPDNDNGAIALIDELAEGDYQYSIDGGALQSDPLFENLSSGSHIIEIHTLTQCVLTTSVALTGADCTELCSDGLDNDGDGLVDCDDPDCGVSAFSDRIVVSDPVCPATDNGSITINGTSGVSYRYSIDGGRTYSTESSYAGLSAGTYHVIALTGDACLATAFVTIGEVDCTERCDDGLDNDGDGLVDCDDPDCGMTGFDDDIVITEPSCPFNDNGRIEINGQLSGIDYSYSINSGADYSTESVFDSLVPGMYTISIRSSDGCTYTQNVTLSSVDCSEICDDGIDNDGDGLMDCADPDCGVAGVYSTLVVRQPGCPFAGDGEISFAEDGSDFNYEYSIDGGDTYSTTRVYSELAPGQYMVSVRANGLCTKDSVIILEDIDCSEICDDGIDNDGDGLTDCADPDCGMTGFADDVIIEHPTCPYNDNGSLTISGQLAGIDYEYSLDGGASFRTESQYSGMRDGTYELVVRSSAGCEYSQTVVLIPEDCSEICDDGIDNDGDGLTDCADPDCGVSDLSAAVTQLPSCPDGDDAIVAVVGQVQGVSYSYSIDGDRYQPSTVFSGVSPGSYTIRVRSAAGCETSVDVTIDEIDCAERCNDGIDNDGDGLIDCDDPHCGVTGFGDDINITDVDCQTQSLGAIVITGQYEPKTYSYSINGGANFQSSPEFVGLQPGDYPIVIRTADGCDYSETVTVGGSIDCGTCDDFDPVSDVDIVCNEGKGEVTVTKNPQQQADYTLSYVDSLAVVEVYRHLPCSPRDELADSSAVPSVDETTLFLISWTQVGLGCTLGCNSPLAYINFDWDQLPANAVITSAELTYKFKAHDPNRGTCHGGSTEVRLRRVISQWDRYHTTSKGFPTTSTSDEIIIPSYCQDVGRANVDITQLIQNSLDSGLPLGLEMTINETDCYKGYDVNAGDVHLVVSYQIASESDNSEYIKYTGLSAGEYQLAATSESGCDYSETVTVGGSDDCSNSCPSFTLSDPIVVDATCPDLDNGTVVYSGGDPDWTYSLDEDIYQELSVFEGLDTGYHTLYVRDSEACVDSVSFFVNGEQCRSSITSQTIARAVVMDINVILQGAYDHQLGEMRTTLNDLGYLPGQKPSTFFGEPTRAGHPYDSAPWYYAGDEGSDMKEYEEGVVDWLLVSLRTDVTRESTVWTGAALLHSDGYVEMLSTPLVSEDEYYVTIEHRNHLPVMSARPVAVVKDAISYDFTSQDGYKSVIGMSQKRIDDGRYVMIGGNGEIIKEISSELDINARDFNSWLQLNGSNSSYFDQDYDMNGDINIKDRIIWEANNGMFSTMPHRRN